MLLPKVTLLSFIFSLILFIAAESYLIYEGVVKVFFIFFIPVFVSSSAISLAPLLLFLIPFLVSLRRIEFTSYGNSINDIYQNKTDVKNKNVSYGGFLMIGPVPIIFSRGMSSRALAVLIIFAIIIMGAWIVIFLL